MCLKGFTQMKVTLLINVELQKNIHLIIMSTISAISPCQKVKRKSLNDSLKNN